MKKGELAFSRWKLPSDHENLGCFSFGYLNFEMANCQACNVLWGDDVNVYVSSLFSLDWA
jgi:hypothetical protein